MRAVVRHRLDEFVGHAGNDETFLLIGADDVVVERRAKNDVARRLVDVGGLIHDDGRIARAGADGAFAAGHRGVNHAAAARDDDKTDAGMLHQCLGAFDRRIGDAGDEVAWAAGGHDGLVDERDVVAGDALRVRVNIEHHRVPRRSIAIVLLMIVEVGLVVGVIAAITPKVRLVRFSPSSPVTAGRKSSVPGVFSVTSWFLRTLSS